MPPILVVDRCRRSLGVNDEKRFSTSPQEALKLDKLIVESKRPARFAWRLE